jgi:hypothetical protein
VKKRRRKENTGVRIRGKYVEKERGRAWVSRGRESESTRAVLPSAFSGLGKHSSGYT